MGHVNINLPSFDGIDAVLIDLDNTLFDSRLTKKLNIKKSIEALGAVWTEDLHHEFQKVEKVVIRNYYAGKMSAEDYDLARGKALTEAFGLNITHEEGSDILIAAIRDGLILLPGAREAVGKLYELMIPLCIASNGIFANQKGRLIDTDLAKYFTHIFVSDTVGSTKPLLTFYEHALQVLGTAPERTMMIGDEAVSDIIGAKRAGLKTCFIMGKPDKDIPPEADYWIIGPEDLL